VILGWLAASLVAGIALGYYWPETASQTARFGLATLLAGGTALAIARGRSGRFAPLALAIAGAAVVVGLTRGIQAAPANAWTPDTALTTPELSLEAVVLEDPVPFGDAVRIRVAPLVAPESPPWLTTEIELDVIARQLTGAAIAGRPPDGYRAGDRLSIAGRLSYGAVSGYAGVTVNASSVRLASGELDGNLLARLRAGANQAIDRTSPEPVAGLVKAMVTGSRTGIDQRTREAFRRSGTSHVLAISGLHVGIFASMALAVSVLALGRKNHWYLLVPGCAVWGYAFMAGLSPPVVRAALMASVFLAGRSLGRQNSIPPAVGAAGALMAAHEPALVGDVSFQLSFLAVLGIALVAPGVQAAGAAQLRRVEGSWPSPLIRLLEWTSSGVAMSVGAISLTGPVIVLRFDAISVWGLPATLLQVPALPFLIVAGVGEALLGALAPGVAILAGGPAWLAAKYVIAVAHFFGSLPGGAVPPSWPLFAGAALYYLLVAALVIRPRWLELFVTAQHTARRAVTGLASSWPPQRPVAGVGLVLALGAAFLVWIAAFSARDGRLHVTFFETTGGDVILITTPGGRQVLVDGGDSVFGAVRSLGGRLPFWDRTLDLIVLTHPHADHVRGLLAVLDRYRVATVLDSPSRYDSDVYAEWLAAVQHEGAARILAVPGTTIELGDGAVIEVLLAQSEEVAFDPNDRSVVLRLRYGGNSFLLMGDLSSSGERKLIATGADLRAEVLKVGHQGSKTSSSNELIAAVLPSLAIVPASIGNRYGHPHAEAMDRISALVSPDRVLVTGVRGTVDVASDGRRLVVRTAR